MITIQNYKKIEGMGLMETAGITTYWLPTADWTGHPTIWIEGITEREDRYQIRVQTLSWYSPALETKMPSESFHIVVYRHRPVTETHWRGRTIWKQDSPQYEMEAILTDTEMAWERIKVETELEALTQSNLPPF